MNDSVKFFDDQFRQQVDKGDFALNPFETAALPHLRGRVLDYGCGLGNLAFAAARRGCSVLALDASPTAIAHIKERAAAEGLPIEAEVADLREYRLEEDFDAVACIGLLMFLDRPTALRVLAHLQERVRPGGLAAVNVLTEGTTFLDMFDPDEYCLFGRDELEKRFADWELLGSELSEFGAPRGLKKCFATVIARKRPAGTDR